MGARAPLTLGGAVRNGLGGSKAWGREVGLGQRQEYQMGGQRRTPGNRGPQGTLSSGAPRVPRCSWTAGSQVPVPAALTTPHLTLSEPLPPPLPEPPQQPPSEPFPSQPPQPPPRVSADSAASQAEHVTSDQESTAFRAQASGGLAGTDGLPEEKPSAM
ncbi:myb-related transcription factor, partner of profilin-like [Lutra lutra]|uniref:myb-related transcription factor, partner of profilin-like n=1 Tax=Lutra lutra TaxID=9657 RepID=UPI001FCFF4B0|nr:myb-related transcription factor, partner of profilin-like [Lutra lutra]